MSRLALPLSGLTKPDRSARRFPPHDRIPSDPESSVPSQSRVLCRLHTSHIYGSRYPPALRPARWARFRPPENAPYCLQEETAPGRSGKYARDLFFPADLKNFVQITGLCDPGHQHIFVRFINGGCVGAAVRCDYLSFSGKGFFKILHDLVLVPALKIRILIIRILFPSRLCSVFFRPPAFRFCQAAPA